MAKGDVKVLVQSVMDRTLIHNGIVIHSMELVELDKEVAKELVEKGYCKYAKTRVVGE